MTRWKEYKKRLILLDQKRKVQFEREQKLTHQYSMVAIEIGAIVLGLIIIIKAIW